MAESKTITLKSKKISSSPSSALPKLFQIKQNGRDVGHKVISNRKSLYMGSRSNSREKKLLRSDSGFKFAKNLKRNQTDKKPQMNQNEGTKSVSSLGLASSCKRQSLIPIPSRNLQKPGFREKELAEIATPKIGSARSGKKSAMKRPERANNVTWIRSSLPSPLRQKKEKPNSERSDFTVKKNLNRSKPKRGDIDQRMNGITDVAVNSINCANSYTTITLSSPRTEETEGLDLQMMEAQECESVYSSDATVEALMDMFATDVESLSESCAFESPRSSMRTSDSSLRLNQIRTPRTTIKTLSRDELVPTSSMELDIANDLEVAEETVEDAMSLLLREAEDDTFVKTFSGVHVAIVDDASHTPKESPSKRLEIRTEPKSKNIECNRLDYYKLKNEIENDHWSDWRTKENELLRDVNYRQSVYHPAVLRRQATPAVEEKTRSKSTEDRPRSGNDERENDAKSAFKKRNLSQTFVSNREVRLWTEKPPQNEDKEIYDRLHLMQNSDYALKEIKKEKSKRERITGALLRLTAKVIHLLAIFNLWPGDNCQLLTSHSLNYGR